MAVIQLDQAGGSCIIRYKSWLLKRVLSKSLYGKKRSGTDAWGHSHLNYGQKEQSQGKEK